MLVPNAAAATLRDVPHLMMSIGASHPRDSLRGRKWRIQQKAHLPRQHFTNAMGTSQASLVRRYLRFCELLWTEMERDLGQTPKRGWNFGKTLGPIYLFEEKLVGKSRGKQRMALTSLEEEIAVDGHMMFLPGTTTTYAATRACGWPQVTGHETFFFSVLGFGRGGRC